MLVWTYIHRLGAQKIGRIDSPTKCVHTATIELVEIIMIYIVYIEDHTFKVKSKQLANSLDLQAICEFGSFYDAVDWIHECCGV